MVMRRSVRKWLPHWATAISVRVIPLGILWSVAGASIALAADTEQEAQSGFATSDGNVVSSSAFIKMLKDKLDNHYEDLEIVIHSCHSGEFATRAADGTNGLDGEWSMCTASNSEQAATTGQTPSDKDIPQNGHAGLHHGGHYYHGYAAQYIKKLKEAPNTSNKDLHQAAKDKNLVPDENPQYASSGDTADNMTVHGGTTSNHAIIFSEPTDYGEETTEALYAALINAGYSNEDIDYLRDGDSGDGNVDQDARLSDLEDALDALATKLQEHEGEEKAYIFIDAHGSYEDRVVAYVDEHIPGVPGEGFACEHPACTISVTVDATLLGLLMEDTPIPAGGFWADNPSRYRVDQPVLRFTAAVQTLAGPTQVPIYLNGVLLGEMTLSGDPNGGDYAIDIPNEVLNDILPGLQVDPELAVTFELPNPADSFIFATDDDFYYDPSFPFMDYGLGLGAAVDAYEVISEPIPAASEWGLIVLTLLGVTVGTIVLGRRRRMKATG